MSKKMAKFLTYWTLLVLVQIYCYALYQYNQIYGFDETINPVTIVAYTLVIIGLLGLVGRYLNNKDMKRGYCDSGIPQECRRRPDLDSTPERMWTLRRSGCGHLAGELVDTFAA